MLKQKMYFDLDTDNTWTIMPEGYVVVDIDRSIKSGGRELIYYYIRRKDV